MKLIPLITGLLLVGLLSAAPFAGAQVAGSTTTTLTESTLIAPGWSARKSILGKLVYNETGAKIGKIEDLIISPEKNLSYVIVGAGGFIGIGRHDVAIPIGQLRQTGGKFVLQGATKESLKALPEFAYGNDSAMREQFVASAEADIARAELKITELQAAASTANSAAKIRLDLQLATLRSDVKNAQAHLDELKRSTAKNWHIFENHVSEALTKLRMSLDAAVGG